MKWMQFFTPAKSMDTDEAQEYIGGRPGENMTVLDVRQASEYQEEHLPGAVLIPLPELPDDWKCPICGAGKKMFKSLG